MNIDDFWAEQYKRYVKERKLYRDLCGVSSFHYKQLNYMVKYVNKMRKLYYNDMEDLYSELKQLFSESVQNRRDTPVRLRTWEMAAEIILLNELLRGIEGE